MDLIALAVGALFTDRYRIGKRIALGGMGAVYEATHIETERVCALKVMLPELVQSQEMRSRFRQEARVAAQVQSEFIVDVLDAGIDGATQMPFIVMEMLQGEELEKRLQRIGRFEREQVVTYLYQAALALDKTHRANIVHRDLKPANLFLTEREDGSHRVKLLDFGIAKLLAEGATKAAATRSMGTPVYMAPEQFMLEQRISSATDIYALGMMAYTLLVGRPYWHEEMEVGANVFAFVPVAMGGPREAACVRARRAGVQLPEAFEQWFSKVTARDPSGRFPTASSAVVALAEALDVALGALRPSSSPVSLARTSAAPAASGAPIATEVLAMSLSTGRAPPGRQLPAAAETQTSAATTLLMARSSTPTPRSRAVPVGIIAAVLGVAALGVGGLVAWRSRRDADAQSMSRDHATGFAESAAPATPSSETAASAPSQAATAQLTATSEKAPVTVQVHAPTAQPEPAVTPAPVAAERTGTTIVLSDLGPKAIRSLTTGTAAPSARPTSTPSAAKVAEAPPSKPTSAPAVSRSPPQKPNTDPSTRD